MCHNDRHFSFQKSGRSMRLEVLNKRTYKNLKVRESTFFVFFPQILFSFLLTVLLLHTVGKKTQTKTLRVPPRIKTVHQKANLSIDGSQLICKECNRESPNYTTSTWTASWFGFVVFFYLDSLNVLKSSSAGVVLLA